MGYLGSEL
jgi:hypothetical protein